MNIAFRNPNTFGNRFFQRAGGDMIHLNVTAPAANYTSLSDNTGTKFQVPAGKKLVVVGIQATTTASDGESFATFGYGDTSVNNSASGPTNAKATSDAIICKRLGNTDIANSVVDCYFEVPAGKYPFLFSYGKATTANFICVLVSP